MRRLDGYFAAPVRESSLLLLFDLDGFKAYNDTFGHSAGDVLLQRLGSRLRDTVGDRGEVFRLGGDEFCILVPGSSLDLPWLRAVASASLRESRGRVCDHLLERPRAAPRRGGEHATTDCRSPTGGCTQRRGSGSAGARAAASCSRRLPSATSHWGRTSTEVARYSAAFAAELGLVGTEAKLVRAAAELHDVGKLALPEDVLQKPGQLDDDEWKIVRQHTLIGERIIAAAEGLEHVALTVRSTHERWDGNGYPDGLRGSQIPLAARIIAICDAYDAITSERPYRHARTSERAIEELRASAGTQFDPELVETFIQHALPALERQLAPRPLVAAAADGSIRSA